MTSAEDDSWFDADDVPLDPDDLLIQQYLDGTLDPAAHAAVERRLDRDEAFASRIASYGNLFAALDLRGARQGPLPLGLADRAVAAWAPDGVAPGRTLLEALGGLRGAALLFGLADVGLVIALGTLVVSWGPGRLLKAWVLGLKEATLWFVTAGSSPEQLAMLVTVGAVGSLAVLAAATQGGRALSRRLGTPG